MKLRLSPNETLAKFDDFMENFKDRKPTKNDVRQFVNDAFEKKDKNLKNGNQMIGLTTQVL